MSEFTNSLKQNSPIKNIGMGYLFILASMTLVAIGIANLVGLLMLIAPLYFMTVGIGLLFADVPDLTALIVIFRVLFGFTVLFTFIGFYFRQNLWGQALVVISLWVWALLGMYGMGLHLV